VECGVKDVAPLSAALPFESLERTPSSGPTDAAVTGTKTDDPGAGPMTKPDWWLENEQIRTEMDLPSYRPPRFADDVYTYEVTEPLEEECGCEIRFVGIDTRYGDDWSVRIDGVPTFPVGHRRDEQGNTIYTVESTEFERRVRAAIEDVAGPDGAVRSEG
jgi:hypothetical protein